VLSRELGRRRSELEIENQIRLRFMSVNYHLLAKAIVIIVFFAAFSC
jgi:hypothetical protein